MKRILINATHNEEIRVALCQGKHMYDFDLENRTREQKKSNIYKAHVTRVEPSLEAVFVEYGAKRQGFLPVREIAKEYLAGNPRNEDIRNLIKEGDTLIVQVEKEERGNKGAALSTYISLAGRYLVLMPNNPRGGGISRQISGKMREDMKRIVASLELPKGMSVIIRTAGIGKDLEDLQHDLNHLLNIWQAVNDQYREYDSPRLVHQEAGVVTRALRDYLTEDISEIWVDSEDAYNEATYFIQSVMPKQLHKLLKYTDIEPMFAGFGIEKQIETAYQREVRLPSGGSIVLDQTEAMVAIDINSAKSNKGADIAETAYHTNLEAAEEIARQLRLRDMGGLIVIDFIDMATSQHQKEVEKRLIDSTKYDRARIQFTEISKFGLLEMSRQRLRPSLEESTGYKCPRCHGNGMIRDLRSLGLSIMRQIENMAFARGTGELQVQVPNDIAAFLLNEKRDSLVYLEQDSGTRITILPHAHMESPDYALHYNAEGFAPPSYERITDNELEQSSEIGYDVDWQTADTKRPKQQPVRQLKQDTAQTIANSQQPADNNKQAVKKQSQQPQAVAWLSNLFAPAPQASVTGMTAQDASHAIETLVNSGRESLGSVGQLDANALKVQKPVQDPQEQKNRDKQDKKRVPSRKPKHDKPRYNKDRKKHNKYNQSNRKSEAKDGYNQEQLSDKQLVNDKKAINNKAFAVEQTDRTTNANATESQKAHKKDNQSNSTQNQSNKVNDQRLDKVKSQKSSQADQCKEEKPIANTDEVKAIQSVQKQTTTEADKDNAKQVQRKTVTEEKQPVQHLSLDTSKPVPAYLQAQMASNKQAQAKLQQADTQEVTKPQEVTEPQQAVVQKAKPDPRADGRAFNDPRVVREQLLASKKPVVEVAQPVAITGSVGQFLRSQLDNVEQRLAKEGVIACFIEAVNKATAPQQLSPVETEIDFDFSNYGYPPLSSDYLSHFHDMVTAMSTFTTSQGKTEVAPTAIGKRADNDPRGQSAEYLAKQEALAKAVPIVDEQETVEAVKDVDATEGAKPVETVAPIEEAKPVEVVAPVEQTPQQRGLFASEALDDVEQTVETQAPAETLSESEEVPAEIQKPVEDRVDTDQIDEDQNDDSHIDTDQANATDEVSQEDTPSNDDTDKESDKAVESETGENDEQGERAKTTFDKYKSMLANVSEQLSTTPSNNINSLFLSTPRVPKTRTRKK